MYHRLIGTLTVSLAITLVLGMCTQPGAPSRSSPPDSVLVDSVRTALDRFADASPATATDSTALREWLDRLLAIGDSLTSENADSAEVLFDEAVRSSRVLADSASLARSLGGRGRARAAQNQTDTALRDTRHAFSISRSLGIREQTAENLGRIGELLQRQNTYEEALARYREALKAYRDLGRRREVARMTSEIGIVYAKTGRFDEALQRWDEALEHLRAIGDRSAVAQILGNQGIVHKNQGRYEKALDKYHKALTIKRGRGDQDDVARCLSNIGVVYLNRDQYREALDHLLEALSLHRTLENTREVAATLNNIGIIYRKQGLYEEALRQYRESLSIKRDLGDQHGVAYTLNNIGIVYKHQGRYDEALEQYRSALSVKRALGDREGISNVLNNLGTVHRVQGDAQEAEGLHRQALSIKREIGDRDGVASTLHDLGDVYRQQDSLDGALRYYQQALTLNRQMGRPAEVASNLEASGRIYLDRNQLERATEMLDRAVRRIEGIRLNTTSPKSRRSLLATEIEAYRALTAAHVRLGRPDSALQTIELGRARLLSEQLAGAARGDTSVSVPSTATLRRTLGSDETALVYANTGTELPLTVLGVTQDSVFAHDLPDRSFRVTLRERYSDELARLRQQDGPLVHAFGEQATATPSTLPSLAEAVRLYRYQLTEVEGTDSVQVSLARQLHDLLVAPIRDHFTPNGDLILVPTGALSYLPMEALRDGDGTYLVETQDVRYVQSLTVLEQLGQRTYHEHERPLLAVGGAEYGSFRSAVRNRTLSSAGGRVQTEAHASALHRAAERRIEQGRSPRPTYGQLGYNRWPSLYGTKLEVRKLERIVGEEPAVLTGSEASEQRLRQMSEAGELSRYRWIHVATHGMALPEAPQLSALVLSQVGASDSLATRDGYLTMQEIAGLDLKAEVAVLSACRTALGQVIAGEGVVNLSHAILRAGANATVVSQWRVHDWSTQQFMASVYRETNHGVSFAEAVARVKRTFITGQFGERNTNPLRWAPFVYYGRG